MNALELLLQRQSFNQLVEPAPEGIALNNILDAAVCVPDHGNLSPYQFIIFKGDARHDLGEIYAEAIELKNGNEEKITKAKNMPLRAPLVIAVIANIKESDKIPESEQLITAGCAVHAMQMAAVAQGYDGIWRTGDLAYNPYVKKQLKLEVKDQIVGFLYLGTAKTPPPKKTRPNHDLYTQYWV